MEGQVINMPRDARATRRRILLRGLGAGGAAAVLGAVGGLSHRAAAQDDNETRVTLPFELSVRQGPSAGLTQQGILALAIAGDGAINRGVFVPVVDGQAGDAINVTGQTTGRAVNLLFQLPAGAVYGVGVAQDDLRTAAGLFDVNTGTLSRPFSMGGPFVGPQAGDSGDWFIVLAVLAGFAVSCLIADAILAHSCG